ncbi:MAG: GNAT family N-acetyltransferase [Betaproteobacteria bacterium RIFCSPLOWO2_02_FULL_67_26]|nr:MAG: GNAT family N-acetyltransferase [Betaproteobacteria bacterium RIFCSPLOWO2_02_FULL_67_26]
MASTYYNELGQPIGAPLPGWKPVAPPPRTAMAGHFCRVEPIDPARHAEELHRANAIDPSKRNFTYLSIGPFGTFDAYRDWMASARASDDPLFHAIIDATTGKAGGIASFMRIDCGNGVMEVGHLNYSPLLQRKPAATEAMYLMMKRAFELGYRRYEWKCDSLNAASRAAARRLGFSYEGVFRQASLYKGRNRDTAWYAMIDSEWPELDRAFRRWLDPSNFDAQGSQRERLSDLTAPILKQRG